ncbi:hypothetical protein HanLR1_Chr09g0335461 [Helianthus annuus]|nr:hypothetical protein HanLR1_Chr09g0335461 [Helianthus annuus]
MTGFCSGCFREISCVISWCYCAYFGCGKCVMKLLWFIVMWCFSVMCFLCAWNVWIRHYVLFGD